MREGEKPERGRGRGGEGGERKRGREEREESCHVANTKRLRQRSRGFDSESDRGASDVFRCSNPGGGSLTCSSLRVCV